MIFLMFPLVNPEPRSLWRCVGKPHLENTSRVRAVTTVAVDVSFVGMASNHRVKQSLAVKMCVFPFELGLRGPTKSIETFCHLYPESVTFCNDVRPIFGAPNFCLQGIHPPMYNSISVLKEG